MSGSSDTESECEGSVSGWDPTNFMETSPIEPFGDIPVSHLHNALETLSSITICAIEDVSVPSSAIGAVPYLVLPHRNRISVPLSKSGSHLAQFGVLSTVPSVLSLPTKADVLRCRRHCACFVRSFLLSLAVNAKCVLCICS